MKVKLRDLRRRFGRVELVNMTVGSVGGHAGQRVPTDALDADQNEVTGRLFENARRLGHVADQVLKDRQIVHGTLVHVVVLGDVAAHHRVQVLHVDHFDVAAAVRLGIGKIAEKDGIHRHVRRIHRFAHVQL